MTNKEFDIAWVGYWAVIERIECVTRHTPFRQIAECRDRGDAIRVRDALRAGNAAQQTAEQFVKMKTYADHLELHIEDLLQAYFAYKHSGAFRGLGEQIEALIEHRPIRVPNAGT